MVSVSLSCVAVPQNWRCTSKRWFFRNYWMERLNKRWFVCYSLPLCVVVYGCMSEVSWLCLVTTPAFSWVAVA